MDNNIRICPKCKRELPNDTDHFYTLYGEIHGMCKECKGRHFTNHLTHIPKDGHIFCKKCDRELPYTVLYFPPDKTTTTGLRNVCRECNGRKFLIEEYVASEKWSDGELNTLKLVYADYTNLELKEQFFPNRSVRAIGSQGNLLKIKKSEEALKRSHAHQAAIVSEKKKGSTMSDETKKKLSLSRKEYYKTHTNVWFCKKRSKESIEKMKISQKAAGRWVGDKNPRHKNPLNGELNGRWQGGILTTLQELRSDTKDWQKQSMEYCNYKCVISGDSFHNIHHTLPFKDIVAITFNNTKIKPQKSVLDYKDGEFDLLRNELKQLHNYYGYGACMHKDIHKLFHNTYGYTNISQEDFLDFIYRIDIGEFDEWFLNNNLSIDINYEYVDYLEHLVYQIKCA